MTKSLKQVFVLALLASMSLFAQNPSKPCAPCTPCEPSCNMPCPERSGDMPGLSQKDLDVITANPNITFVYISTDVIKVLRELSKGKMSAQVNQLIQYLAENYKAAPAQPVADAINCAIDCCKNDPAKRSVLEQYREDLASGDAVISVSDEDVAAEADQQDEMDNDVTRRRKCKNRRNKCFCRLTVRDCLKTGNLVVCNNAHIGGCLRIGNIAICPTGVTSTVGGVTFFPKFGLETGLLNLRGRVCLTAGTFTGAGAGFTVTPISTSSFRVNYTTPFASIPSVTLGLERQVAQGEAFLYITSNTTTGFTVTSVDGAAIEPLAEGNCVNFIVEGSIV